MERETPWEVKFFGGRLGLFGTSPHPVGSHP